MEYQKIGPLKWSNLGISAWLPTLDTIVIRSDLSVLESPKNFGIDEVILLAKDEENCHRQSFVWTSLRNCLTCLELKSNGLLLSFLDHIRSLRGHYDNFYLLLPIKKNVTENSKITKKISSSITDIAEICESIRKIGRFCEMIVETLNFVHLCGDYERLKLPKLLDRKQRKLRSLCRKCGENFDELSDRASKAVPSKFQNINPFKHEDDSFFFEYLYIYYFIFELPFLSLPYPPYIYYYVYNDLSSTFANIALSRLRERWKIFLNGGVKTRNLLDLRFKVENTMWSPSNDIESYAYDFNYKCYDTLFDEEYNYHKLLSWRIPVLPHQLSGISDSPIKAILPPSLLIERKDNGIVTYPSFTSFPRKVLFDTYMTLAKYFLFSGSLDKNDCLFYGDHDVCYSCPLLNKHLKSFKIANPSCGIQRLLTGINFRRIN